MKSTIKAEDFVTSSLTAIDQSGVTALKVTIAGQVTLQTVGTADCSYWNLKFIAKIEDQLSLDEGDGNPESLFRVLEPSYAVLSKHMPDMYWIPSAIG